MSWMTMWTTNQTIVLQLRRIQIWKWYTVASFKPFQCKTYCFENILFWWRMNNLCPFTYWAVLGSVDHAETRKERRGFQCWWLCPQHCLLKETKAKMLQQSGVNYDADDFRREDTKWWGATKKHRVNQTSADSKLCLGRHQKFAFCCGPWLISQPSHPTQKIVIFCGR